MNRLRAGAILAALLTGVIATSVFVMYSTVNSTSAYALIAAFFLFLSTTWLAWGAALGLIGLPPMEPQPERTDLPAMNRTIVLVPVCNEDPVVTFARVVAMDRSLAEAGVPGLHFAILSDTRDAVVAEAEAVWFARLLEETRGRGRIFYRRRTENSGRKAGNIEDFFRRSGAAYDYALILDADSLMDGAAVIEMVRRMDADPELGLLQTLPVIVRAGSVFGRAMQFAATFYSPVYSRGLARLQGRTGPFWGHNAMVRVRAFAESCGLPTLPGPAPFGGTIMSHDYVEAALLARAGWTVRLDPDLGGSFEEAPESIIEHAKRDRRWCQGNLQHAGLIRAPGLRFWSRLTFVLGIVAYIAPVFWAGFLLAAIGDRVTMAPPDYFPDPHQFFPVFPTDETAKAIGLAIGVGGLLLMPKLLIALGAILSGRARAFGGAVASFLSVVADLLLSSLIAPVLMAFQTRSVYQVLMGRDGGWPPNRRGGAELSVAEAWRACRFIVLWGAAGMVLVSQLVPELVLWLVPVLVPMILSPVIISVTSAPSDRLSSVLFSVPVERHLPRVLALHDEVLARWSRPPSPVAAPYGQPLSAA